MQGWKIFTHSVRMVFGNLGPALRISGVLYLVYVAVNVYFMNNFGNDIQTIQQNMAAGLMPEELPSGLVSMMVLNFVVAILTSLWIAVIWHRYVLLEENSGAIIPPLYIGTIAAYLGKTIQLTLMLVAIGILLGVLLGFGIGLLVGSAAASIVPLVLLGVILYLSYRLGLVMPAVAIQNPMTFKSSWEKTKLASGPIAQLAAIAVVFAIVIQIPSNMNPNQTSVINLVYSYAVGWIAMMVGVSVLTTLYGVYAEGREL